MRANAVPARRAALPRHGDVLGRLAAWPGFLRHLPADRIDPHPSRCARIGARRVGDGLGLGHRRFGAFRRRMQAAGVDSYPVCRGPRCLVELRLITMPDCGRNSALWEAVWSRTRAQLLGEATTV